MVDIDSLILERLIDEAWKQQFLTYPNPPVGAAIFGNDKLLSFTTHKQAGSPHAEVLAFKEAYKRLTSDSKIDTLKEASSIHDYLVKKSKNLFNNCTLYITLEPCNHYGKTPPCSRLIAALKPKKVIYSASDESKNASGGASFLISQGVDIIQHRQTVKRANELILPFTIWQKRAFVFYKMAVRIDGTYDGGTISCYESRKLVHHMRSRVDLLAISGDSVRADRPILDARLVGKRAPDVQILTSKPVDRDIPLFDIANREVSIKKELDIEKPSLIMVEGGGRLLEEIKSKVDILGLFIAPKSGGQKRLPPNLNLEHIHSYQIDVDTLSYYKLHS